MRQIKFRAWDKKRKVWLKDNEFNINPNGVISLELNCDSNHEEDIILVQFTGLLDKNGKEIFDGYIIKSSTGGTYIVSWNEERLCWWLELILDGMFTPLSHLIGKTNEVIGNIYENPELLEDKK